MNLPRIASVMGSNLAPEYGPERQGQSGFTSTCGYRQGRGHAGFQATVGFEGRIAAFSRVVAREQAQHPMIPIIKPVMDNREADAAAWVYLSADGSPRVRKSRPSSGKFADFVGATHACAASNCTSCASSRVAGDRHQAGTTEVITVSHFYIATANVIRYCRRQRALWSVDVDPANLYNIDSFHP